MSKRKRDPTFVASEKMVLLDLIEKHFDIIECKKTDAMSIRQKNEEWQKLAIEFNSNSSIHPRDWIVLKNCWENLKKKAKQQQTSKNQHYLGTGGGPPKKFDEDPVVERTLVLIQARVSGYVNSFDSDGTNILVSGSNTTQETPISPTKIVISEIEISDTNIIEMDSKLSFDWSQYTPSMLKNFKNPALCRSPSPSTSQKSPSVDQQPPLQVTPDPIFTPLRTRKEEVSRRRPVLRREKATKNLAQERLATLIKANEHAAQEHEVQMRILRLQEEREKEMLEQEKLRTLQERLKLELLELELKRSKDH